MEVQQTTNTTNTTTSSTSSSSWTNNTNYVSQEALDDADDGKYHWLIFADATNIYAFEPAVSTPVTRIGSGFTNIVNVDTDLENYYLFVADQSSDGTIVNIYRYDIVSNTTDEFNPFLTLNMTSQKTHYSGSPTTGLCADDETNRLFFAVPSTQTIYENNYSEEKQWEMNNDVGVQIALYQQIPSTSWVSGVACNGDDEEIYWFNANSSSTQASSTLYKADYETDTDSIESLATGIATPTRPYYSDDYIYYI